MGKKDRKRNKEKKKKQLSEVQQPEINKTEKNKISLKGTLWTLGTIFTIVGVIWQITKSDTNTLMPHLAFCHENIQPLPNVRGGINIDSIKLKGSHFYYYYHVNLCNDVATAYHVQTYLTTITIDDQNGIGAIEKRTSFFDHTVTPGDGFTEPRYFYTSIPLKKIYLIIRGTYSNKEKKGETIKLKTAIAYDFEKKLRGTPIGEDEEFVNSVLVKLDQSEEKDIWISD